MSKPLTAFYRFAHCCWHWRSDCLYHTAMRIPEEWKDGAYAYAADNSPLSVILQDFASSHGVDANVTRLPIPLSPPVCVQTAPKRFSTGWRWSTVFSGSSTTTRSMSALSLSKPRAV